MVAAPPHPHSSYNLIDKKIPITIFLTGNRDLVLARILTFVGLYKNPRVIQIRKDKSFGEMLPSRRPSYLA